MSEIQAIARQRIHAGQLEEFKRLAAACMRSARTKDTGTLQYDFFINAEGTECIVYERYRDSAALIEHFQNLGDLAAAIFRICTTTGEVLGTPSPELRKALEGTGVQIYAPYFSM